MDRSALTDESSQYAFKHLWVEVTCFDSYCKSLRWSFQRSQFAVVLSLLHPSVSGILCLSCEERFRGSWGCQVAAVGDGRLGWRQQTDADCCTSVFSWEGAQCLIAVVWTAALQLSQDRCRYLFLHANKTGASYPPGSCWKHANCLQHLSTSSLQRL